MLAKLFVKDGRLRPIWRVLVYVIAVLLCASLLWDLYDVAAGRAYRARATVADDISLEFATALAVLLCSYVLRRYLDRRSVTSLGFAPRGPWLRLLGVGMLFGAGMVSIAYLVESLSGAARVTGFGSLSGDLRLIGMSTAVFLAAAFVEEMSLRGYVMQNLWEEWGVVPAIVISSSAFAVLHLGNTHALERTLPTVIGLVAFGLWACMSLLWTKSLWLALGAHVAWNLFEGPVFGLPVSGVIMPAHTIIVESVTGPVWLTGGAFGPEAGVSALVAMLIGFVVLRALYLKEAFADVFDARESYAKKS